MAVNWNLANYDPIGAQSKGNAYAQQLLDQMAKSQAGQQYASGDYAGAANTIGQRGDFRTAEALRGITQQRAIDAENLAEKQVAVAQRQQAALQQVVPFLK